jgi:carbonic anhydrase/acetyltransferase-like protein (isoleucine patch superfamily)
MATIIEFEGRAPAIEPGASVAPTAVLIGDVRIAAGASIWFGAVLRADTSHIEIGPEASIQDNAVLHCAPRLPTVVEARATVGHGAILEGCVIEDGALIGMGAVVLHHARVGRGALVAAGAVVPERMDTGSHVLVAGVPAVVKQSLDERGRAMAATAAGEYQRIVAAYRRSGADWADWQARQ